MGTVVVLGERVLVQGYVLAGAIVAPAEGEAELRRVWQGLPGDVSLVILTAAAAEALADDLRSSALLTAAMPE